LARAQAVAARARIARRLIVIALAAAVGVGAWLAVRPSHRAERTLLVGVDDDTLKWTPFPLTVVRRQQALGARAVRVWVPWRGERAPSAVRRVELSRAEIAARRTDVVLAVFGFAGQTPVTTRAQVRFCAYARAALGLVPDARAVVVWNEANSPTFWRGTPAAYEALLARCYDRLHSKHVAVLDSTASGHDPIAFLSAVASAYRASGRTAPLVDGFGHNPYPLTPIESPAARHRGDFLGEADYPRLVAALRAGFGRAPEIWYLEDGFQTDWVTLARQARNVATAIAMAACQPLVHAFFNFELVDEKRLAGWQSGLIFRGGKRKPAATSFAAAARSAAKGCSTRP
jgi:hypothetical protein